MRRVRRKRTRVVWRGSTLGETRGGSRLGLGLLALLSGCVVLPLSGIGGNRPDNGLQTSPAPSGFGSNTGTGSIDPATAQGPVSGLVLDLQGRPAPNVRITAFLAGTSPLIGNAGSGLANNSGAAYHIASGVLGARWLPPSSRARRLAAGVEVRTDAQGRYALAPTEPGKYNIEAVLDQQTKAWRAKIEYRGGDSRVDAGKMTLAPVGQISGKVRAIDSRVTDFTGTQAYIPGSSFVAVTDNAGAFTLSGVPAGAFELGAFNVNLGDALLPDASNPDPITVLSGQTSRAPDLVLAARLPELDRLTRARTLDRTDNGASGTEVDLHGKHFGLARGIPVKVTFNGVPAEKVERLTEELLRATVPSGAANGKVAVTVGNLLSNQISFRVIKTLNLACDGIMMLPASTRDFAPVVVALDSEGIAVRASGDPVSEDSLLGPNLKLEVDSNRAVVSATGLVEALSLGNVVLTAKAGSLVRTCGFTVAANIPTPQPTLGPPALESITPANGGVGAMVTLAGENFGSGTESIAVTFAGVPAADPVYVDSGTLRATVPVGAISGLVVAKVGTRNATGKPFSVVQSLSLQPESADLLVGSTRLLTLGAIDTSGQPVSGPAVVWESSSPSVSLEAVYGQVRAVAPGDSVVLVRTGIVTRTASIHVYRVDTVSLSKTALTLNAMPESGDPDLSFDTSTTLKAEVKSSDGRVRKVLFTASDADRITVTSADGITATITTVRGAGEGMAYVVATAVDDPRIGATASVTVTAEGGANVEVR